MDDLAEMIEEGHNIFLEKIRYALEPVKDLRPIGFTHEYPDSTTGIGTLIIYTDKPGVVIGYRGETIEEIVRRMNETFSYGAYKVSVKKINFIEM